MENGECGICNEEFTEYGDIVPDAKHPRGMRGAWRDDRPDNIRTVHWWRYTGRRDRAEAELEHMTYEFRGSVPAG